MIARIWRGRVRPGLLEEYRGYVERVWLPDLRAIAGNLGAHILTRDTPTHGHIVTLSLWENEAAIEAFAGGDVTRARYYPEDERYLLDFPEHVEHFDTGK